MLAVGAGGFAGMAKSVGGSRGFLDIAVSGQAGRYGELAKMSRKDGLTPDHIPSHASNVRAADAQLGRKLTKKENAEIKANGGAVVIGEKQHVDNSRTYGARNNAEKQIGDAANPPRAVMLDMECHKTYLNSIGVADNQIRKAVQDLLDMRN